MKNEAGIGPPVSLFKVPTAMPAPSIFELETDAAEAESGYRTWFRAMTAEAEKITGNRYWLPVENVMLRSSLEYSEEGPLPNTWLAYDGTGKSWTVQLNPPGKPGTGDGLTSVAKDSSGKRWLLRQDWLKKNTLSHDVRGTAFREGTGLAPVQVLNGRKDREWYRVAELDKPSDEIRRQTIEFVTRCAVARTLHAKIEPDQQDANVLKKFQEESADPFVKGAQPPQPEKVVRRLQGEVWQALNSELKKIHKRLDKPAHAAGYEVDGCFKGGKRDLLIEIKTDSLAQSLYAGYGQLMLYRELIPTLKDHEPVLLVPGDPPKDLIQAIRKLQVRVETYERVAPGKEGVVFSESFRKLCGLPLKKQGKASPQ